MFKHAEFVWFSAALKLDSENFPGRIMGAGTAFGLYNTSLQYQQQNASRASCVSSAEHKEDSKTLNLKDFQMWTRFLELSRNHRCALSRKLWGVEKSDGQKPKNCDSDPYKYFLKNRFLEFSGKNNGSGYLRSDRTMQLINNINKLAALKGWLAS